MADDRPMLEFFFRFPYSLGTDAPVLNIDPVFETLSPTTRVLAFFRVIVDGVQVMAWDAGRTPGIVEREGEGIEFDVRESTPAPEPCTQPFGECHLGRLGDRCAYCHQQWGYDRMGTVTVWRRRVTASSQAASL